MRVPTSTNHGRHGKIQLWIAVVGLLVMVTAIMWNGIGAPSPKGGTATHEGPPATPGRGVAGPASGLPLDTGVTALAADGNAAPSPVFGQRGPGGGTMVPLEDENGNIVMFEEATDLAEFTGKELAEMAVLRHPWTRLVAEDPELAPLRELVYGRKGDAGRMAQLVGIALGDQDGGLKVTPPARMQIRVDLADLNGDQVIGSDDLLVMLELQGREMLGGADLDADGTVGPKDLEVLTRLMTAGGGEPG